MERNGRFTLKSPKMWLMRRPLNVTLVRRAVGRRLCLSAAEIEDGAMRAPRSLSAAEIEDAAMRAPRRRGERVDSVDSVTLADRVFHLERMSKADIDPKILAEVRVLRCVASGSGRT